MCGIAGVIAQPGTEIEPPLRVMAGCLAHRGPDDEGVTTHALPGAVVGLAFRRLSILDLSPAGHQPMSSPDGTVTLVFNGEIYNFRDLRARLLGRGHRFVSTGDTEVLAHWLAEFGPEGLTAVEGMYACAWVDHRAGNLVLARDPFGIKPLYYAETKAGLVFASEVRTILDSGFVPRRVCAAGMASVLAFGAVQAPDTIIEGIREFPAGHWSRATPTGLAGPRRFFQFPEVCPPVPEPVALEDVWGRLDHAVSSHLVSDVPVGVLLSSGIDSRLVAATAARHSAGIRSFTLGFRDRPEVSETKEAAGFAATQPLTHTEVWVDEPECLEATESWLRDIDQPSVDGLNVYIICRAVRRAGIKVALSGLGGDELFGGYPSFVDAPRLSRFVRRAGWAPSPARRALAGLLTFGRGTAAREKLSDMLAGPGDLRRIYLHRRRVISDRGFRRLGLSPKLVGLTPAFQPPGVEDRDPPAADPVTEISRLECRYYQGNMLLRDADANSMSHGLELRVPLLDQRLAEYALSLPGAVKLPCGRADKHLLREVLSGKLGVRSGDEPKRGFTLPVGQWLRGPLAGLAESAVSRLKRSSILDPRGVSAIWDGFTREPDTPAWSRAFILVALGNYLERHRLSE
jgi:asparagine synthase (glutamine-hydrolysing)